MSPISRSIVPRAEVSDEDVDEMLQTLREQRKEWNPVERTAQPGDQVVIEYVAETDEGRVPAGRQTTAHRYHGRVGI